MKKKKSQKTGKKRKEKKPAKKKQAKKQSKGLRDPVKELEKLLTKPEKQKRTFVTKDKAEIEMKTSLRKEIGDEDEELKDLISPKRSIDLKILRYLEELPKEQFTALLLVEPTNYSKINHELIRILINHTQGRGLYVTLNRASDFLKDLTGHRVRLPEM